MMPYLPMLAALAASLGVGHAILRLCGPVRSPVNHSIQAIHAAPVPRIGGVAILSGLAAGVALQAAISGLAPGAQDGSVTLLGGTLWPALAPAILPALVAGLHEDITGRGDVRLRLAATILSGLLFAMLSGCTVAGLGLPGIDWLLMIPGAALLVTAVAIGGVAQAFNLIDGCHGLAAGTVVILLLALAGIATDAGDSTLAGLALVALAAVGGFLVLNFPGGRFFMGDSGAYLTGATIAALAVALPARNPGVSPLLGLLLLAYPVSETLHSMVRRAGGDLRAIAQPDLGHLHSLTYRALLRRVPRPATRNAVTGAMLWLLPALSAALAVSLAQSEAHAVLTAAAAIAVLHALAHGYAGRTARAIEPAQPPAPARARAPARSSAPTSARAETPARPEGAVSAREKRGGPPRS